MVMDRGSRAGGSGGQHGYRRDQNSNGYRSGWGKESDNSNADYASSGNWRDGRENVDVSSKYDSHQQRDSGSRRGGGDDNGQSGGAGRHHQSQASSQNGKGNQGEMMPKAMIESLEKQIGTAHTDMTQALNDMNGKENEKFDLIFGILIELQRRQAVLEESVRTLKTQLPAPGGNQMNAQMANQGAIQGVNQSNGHMFMPNQMNMGQQYGNMVAADGSQQAFFRTYAEGCPNAGAAGYAADEHAADAPGYAADAPGYAANAADVLWHAPNDVWADAASDGDAVREPGSGPILQLPAAAAAVGWKR